MRENLKVFKSLNIEANEVIPVLLLIMQSVFLGIFYGTFDIGAHTLFLKTFPEDMIPKAYIISGIVGIILTSIFSKLQSRIRFSRLANSTLLFISLVTLIMWVLFEFTNANWIIFIVFIFLGPLNILAILAFWGTVGRIFNLRQGKRLFGIIDSGQVFGIIISSYAIPLVLTYLHGTKNLLLISAGSIAFAFLIEALIASKFKIDSHKNDQGNITDDQNKTEEEQVKVKTFFKDKYIMYMAMFVAFSMFAAFFIQYSFLVVTNEQYPLEDDLAKYLGFFTGSMMIFTLIIKTFVYSKLLKTYGLKISLLLSSVLLALFTGVAIIVGFASGFEKTSPGFIYFFLFISMGKLFNKTLKDALEVPAFKLLYQSLRKSIRFDVQAKIDGTINEIAALTSGILLSILGLLTFIKLIHFSVFLFALLIVWTLITIRLYKEYRNSLEDSLKQDISDEDDLINKQEIAQFNTLINKPKQFLTKLNHIRAYIPLNYLNYINILINIYPPEVLNFLSKGHLIEILLLNIKNETPENWAEYINKTYPASIISNASVKELSNLIDSSDLKDVNTAITFLKGIEDKNRLTLLGGLLRVPNLKTQAISIRICGSLKDIELLNTLGEHLDSENLMSYSIISLNQMNEKNIKQLIQMFYKSDISLLTQLGLIEIIGNKHTPETIYFLLDNISNHRREIKEKSIICLKKLEYQPTEDELPKMFHPITEASQNLSWDISALASIGTTYGEKSIAKALKYEFIKHQKILFDLLAITYDANSVKHVWDYLSNGTSEGISYALELFDLFLSEEIKPMVMAIFEDIPLAEKTRLLENFFPVEVRPVNELLLDIINRDPNLISKETKKTALYEYGQLFKEVTDDLIAQLFNPVPELQYIAAQSANKLRPSIINQLKNRIGDTLFKNIEKVKSAEKDTITLFDIDENSLAKININNNNLIELSEFIEIRKSADLHFLNINNELYNYFVFLISNQNNMSQENPESFYIEGNYNINEIELEKADYFVGIKKSNMNKLLLTNSKIIHDFINTII